MKEMYYVFCNQTLVTDGQAGKGRRAWCVLRLIADVLCGVVKPGDAGCMKDGWRVDMATRLAVRLNRNTNN